MYICIYMLLYVYVKVGPRVGLVPMHPSMDLYSVITEMILD